MSLLLTNSAWSMQPGPTATATDSAEQGAAPAEKRPDGFASAQPMILMLVMVGIFYFLLFRPQQKRQRELDTLFKSMRKGDKVRTTGGIRGEILDLTDTEATLLIAEKVKINVLRSHIAARIGADATAAVPAAKDSASKESAAKNPVRDSAKDST